MQILALETSTEFGSCALWRDGVLTERVCPAGRSHSETLLPLVRELLSESGIGVAALDGIAFGVGPGAFTGLRVACGAAQGLAVAADLPLVPVSSLACMAAASGGERVLSLLDARMGEVYYATFRRQGEAYQQSSDIRLAAPADIVLPTGEGWLACGNAPTVYPELHSRLLAAGIDFVPGILPQACVLVRLAVGLFQAGEAIDPAMAAPLYVRDKVAKTVAERLAEGGKA